MNIKYFKITQNEWNYQKSLINIVFSGLVLNKSLLIELVLSFEKYLVQLMHVLFYLINAYR